MHKELQNLRDMEHERDRCYAYKIFVRKLEGKRPLEDLGVDERLFLKWAF
jgi:hypothetical protein